MTHMKINHSEYTISELMEMFKRKEITINTTYQRAAGLWPITARTYFIDTILEGFPFPKLYFYQSFDKTERKPIKEVVDGQQRITTIRDFIDGKFKLGSASARFSGMCFKDLDEESQEAFLMYSVPADVILAADKPALLEMFRRINAYTAPLNSAEKRHSEFQGVFKWFINDLADKWSPILESYHVLTPKQIVRMGDSELLAELVLVLDEGIVHRSAASLRKLYVRYDKEFSDQNIFKEKIADFFECLNTDFTDLRDTFMMKPYAFHSLFTAMTHLKYGIPGGEEKCGHPPINQYYHDRYTALQQLVQLADAHEIQDTSGEFKEYVEACLTTTTKMTQRTARSKFIIKALLAK